MSTATAPRVPRARHDARLDAFFDAMGATRLLRAEEEVELAQAIERGRDARAALDRGGLPPGQRRALERDVAAGEAARERFVAANLRLVVHEAARSARSCNVGLEDLIQDGSLGLLQAVDRYDWRRGYRFSTYATWWVKQALQRGFASSDRTIRLPYAVHAAQRRLGAARARLEAVTGREPTLEELAAATNLDAARAREALEAPPDAGTLDRQVADRSDTTLGELLAVAADDPAQEACDRVATAEVVARLAQRLDERSATMLRLRFGLDGAEPLTYEQIGVTLAVSRETVRTTISRALARLREDLGVAPAR
jgi:RNA polymerase sigma factor (sigma-70 family)